MTLSDNDGDLNELKHVKAEREHRRLVVFERQQDQLIAVLSHDHGFARTIKVLVTPAILVIIALLMAMLIILFLEIISSHFPAHTPGLYLEHEAPIIPWAIFASLLFAMTTISAALVIGVFRAPPSSAVEDLLTRGSRVAASNLSQPPS